ncbi:MAG: imidazolonepropionase [Geminicoccaceae bacterium]|nr:imidazolonepropionase [Geminicoccaceae bacterium]
MFPAMSDGSRRLTQSPRARVVAAVLFLTLGALACGRRDVPPSSLPAPPIAIVHATIVDVTGGPAMQDRTVLIDGDRITQIGPAATTAIPADADVVDATGRYLIPGLWDMHAHSWTDRQTRENIFPLYVAFGVTGVRDMTGDCLTVCADRDSTFWRPPTIALVRAWRADIAAGRLLGPWIVASSAQMDRGDNPWPGSVHVGSEAEARAMVQTARERRVDFIKVHDDRLPRAIFLAAAAEARRLGLRFDGHVPESVTPAEASDAGQRSMEHLRRLPEACSPQTDSLFARWDAVDTSSTTPRDSIRAIQIGLEDAWIASVSVERCAPLFARFVRNGTWHVPTLAVLWPYAFHPDSGPADTASLDYVPNAVRVRWEKQLGDVSAADFRFDRALFRKRLELVHGMVRAGVGVLAGSDPTNEYVVAGFGLHHELRLFVQAGLSPMKALQTATIAPARFLGSENETGTVAVGKLADLVLLDADPMVDIRHISRIHAVILHGRLLRRPALDLLLSRAASAVR